MSRPSLQHSEWFRICTHFLDAAKPFSLALLSIPYLKVESSTLPRIQESALPAFQVQQVIAFQCALDWLSVCKLSKTYMQCRPYFLPCAATSLIAALAAVSSICLMHETLPSIVQKRQQDQLQQQHLPGKPFHQSSSAHFHKEKILNSAMLVWNMSILQRC